MSQVHKNTNASYPTLFGVGKKCSKGPSGSERGNGDGTENAMRSIESINEAIRVRLQERMREGFTRIVGFIGPLLRLKGLLENEARKGRRLWALPSPS